MQQVRSRLHSEDSLGLQLINGIVYYLLVHLSWLLRDLAHIIAGPINAIHNSSIREEYVPDLWRMANVCPLLKTTKVSDIKKDTRPISLTPVLSKLLEYHPVQYIRQACPNIDSSQYGSVRKSSTTHALLRILLPVYKAVDDSSNFARLLLVDFSKAFDHIHHATFLDKLNANGVPQKIVKWYKGFLTDRQQRVKMGSVTSEWRTVNGGVPQGTISGPELFIHVVSDFHTDIPDVKYMDDTTLIEIAKSRVALTCSMLLNKCRNGRVQTN